LTVVTYPSHFPNRIPILQQQQQQQQPSSSTSKPDNNVNDPHSHLTTIILHSLLSGEFNLLLVVVSFFRSSTPFFVVIVRGSPLAARCFSLVGCRSFFVARRSLLPVVCTVDSSLPFQSLFVNSFIFICSLLEFLFLFFSLVGRRSVITARCPLLVACRSPLLLACCDDSPLLYFDLFF
jgi:hypothetical protein